MEGKMIICKYCQEKNQPVEKTCQKCGNDLLPGETVQEKISSIIGMIIVVVIGWFITLLLTKYFDLGSSIVSGMIYTIPLLITLITIVKIIDSFKETPDYIKYITRAERHKSKEPIQALSDSNIAIKLARSKNLFTFFSGDTTTIPLYKMFLSLCSELEASNLSLEYKLTLMSIAFDIVAKEIIKKYQEIINSVNKEIGKLVNEKEYAMIGYCTRCNKAVVLVENQKCSLHPKAIISNIRIIQSANIDDSLVLLYEEVNKKKGVFTETEIKVFLLFMLFALIIIVIRNVK